MMGPTEPLASGVISYNGDSERGWNDPPTLSYVGVTKKGPKLDLRKRVSHQEALTGRKVTSPALTQNPPSLYNQGNDLSNDLSNLLLSQQPSSRSSSVPASPCHSRHSSGTYTPPLLPDPKSYGSAPPQFPIPSYSSGQNTIPGLLSYGIVQVPPTSNIVNPATTMGPPKIFSPVETTVQSDNGIAHPLAQKSSTSTQPVTTAPPSNLGSPLFSFPSCVNVVPISSALDASHVRSNPDISSDTTPQTVNTNQVPNTSMATQGPLIFTPSPTSAHGFTPPPMGGVGKRSPILNRTFVNGSGPRPTVNRSPVSTPPGGHSASTTPRSLSPDNGYRSGKVSRHNSEEFDGQDGMRVTVEAIEETIIKCSNILKAREVDDVKKKVEIMKQLWVDNKLSLPVQMTMRSLTKALLDGETDTAHKLHVKLMVEYVGEVKQWMVAIKRLISAVVNINTPVS